MQYYLKSVKEVFTAIESNAKGLTGAEAQRRLTRDGKNKLAEAKKDSLLKRFLSQMADPMILVLIAAAAVSGVTSFYAGESFADVIIILAVVVINALLGMYQESKAEKAIEALQEMAAATSRVLRDGRIEQVKSEELVVGDVVLLEAGDAVPADGRIVENAGLKVDESALTGESLGVDKDSRAIEGEAPLGDRLCMVYSGSFVTYGRGEFLVTSIGMETEVGKIATLLSTTKEKRTPLQMNLDNFGKKLSILILVFCGILFGISVLRGEAIGDAFLFAVALAVAAIPEALSSIVTIVLSFGTQKMAREHAIIRKLQAVEGLGSVSVICSDKTGTLTQNKMTVEDYYVHGRKIKADDIDLNNPEEMQLLLTSMLCNDSSIAEGKELGDPTETALINIGLKLGVSYETERAACRRVGEIPFDSDRKLMSTCNRITGERAEFFERAEKSDVAEGQDWMLTKGAVDVLLDRVTKIQTSGGVREITERDKAEIAACNQSFSENGLRVLAFAYKKIEEGLVPQLDDEQDLVFLGLISMMDPPREESKAAVAECIRAGIKPVMITGDHKVTAAAIAKKIGILKDESEACEGASIDGMTDEELREHVDHISVYARVSPEHKIRIVRAWQDKGNIVAMTGDGVNDAPALKQADIGVAMGITGTEVSKDASSMILTDDNFATIVKAVENGRNLYKNIKYAIQFLLSGNFGAILVVLFASVFALPVPFAPVHLLFINLLTDSLPAIALGLEPHRKELMNEKPRPADESILTGEFLARISAGGVSICVMTTVAFLIGYHGWFTAADLGGSALLGSTMAFGTLCVSRLFHGFNCKSDRPVVFTRKVWNNKWLIGAFVLGMILITLAIACPGLDHVFKVQTLGLPQLMTVYGLAFLNIPVIQLVKAIGEKLCR